MPQSFDAVFVSSGSVRVFVNAGEGQLTVPVLATTTGQVAPQPGRARGIFEFRLKASRLHGRSVALAAVVTDVNVHTNRTSLTVKIKNGNKLVYQKTLSEDAAQDRGDVSYGFFFDFFEG